MTQPLEAMLLIISPGGMHLTGGRSSERVWMTQFGVVEIQPGVLLQQRHAGLPVGLDGADIHPVAEERVGIGPAHFNDVRDDVFAKIVG